MSSSPPFDVIIVGGGPAGCVLAARLSEDAHRSVLLVEAGPDYGADLQAWPNDLRDPTSTWLESHPWGYTQPRSTGGAPITLPRARVLGGSATINAVLWMRGSRADYDNWEARGNPGWGFDDLLPYFQRVEADPLADTSPLHGSAGPVPVSRITEDERTPTAAAFAAAAAEHGIDWLADLNGSEKQRPGLGPSPRNSAESVRMNPVFTYLAQARDRANLTILPDTLVDRVVFEGTRAVGVQIASGGVLAGREIVLTSGAYGSPAILLRSGIGPPEHLHALGIPVVHALGGVGEQLMDHPKTPGALCEYQIAPRAAPDARAFIQVLLTARSAQVTEEIDLHLCPIESFDEQLGRWRWNVIVCLMYSRSMGRVRLTARDPTATLAINHKYFADVADLEALCDGVTLVADLVRTKPLVDILTASPGAPVWHNRDDLRTLVQQTVETTYHPSTTCKMGPVSDPMAVVDQAGRVYGIDALRVADASIFPYSPRCNLHFPICAVAEKVSDAIRMDS